MNKLFEISSKFIFPSNPTTGTLGSIDLNVALIQWSGIPLLGIRQKSQFAKVFLIIYGSVIMPVTIFIYTGFEIYDLVLCWGNLNEITQNTCLSLTHITGAVKVVNAFYRRADILRMIEQFRVMTKKYVISEEQKQAFFWGEFENKVPLTMYATIVGFTGILGIMMLMLNPHNIAGKIFPYRVQMPDFIPYNIQVVYMSMAVFLCALQIVGIDYLNVTLINQTRYQMKTLNIAFDRLSVNSKLDVDFNKYLNSLVEHHNIILQIRKELEGIFKYPLLLQFLTSLLIFAMTGFQATVQSDSQIAILIYFYCGCIFCELFVYCWFGNEVSEQMTDSLTFVKFVQLCLMKWQWPKPLSANVNKSWHWNFAFPEAINKTLASRGYNSSWYNFDEKYRQSLLVFLMNAQRPFYFTAGGFMQLSLTTFSRILSKSYTYIAVLRQIYADK